MEHEGLLRGQDECHSKDIVQSRGMFNFEIAILGKYEIFLLNS